MSRSGLPVIVAALVLSALATVSSQSFRARMCTISAADQAFCNSAADLLTNANITFSCVQTASDAACMAAIQAGEADWRTFASAEMYTANKDFDLKVVVAEDANITGLVSTSYYSVGVVPADLCTPTTTLASLRGKRSCHTGYRRNAGWQNPIGYLAGSGVMPIVRGIGGIADDAESAANFFNGSCAANYVDAKGLQWAPLCSACYKNATHPVPDCTRTERYWDYPGSFRGVVEGACDVSFTRQSIPIDYTTGGAFAGNTSWVTKAPGEFRLICPQGGCAAVTDFARCNLGRVPSDAVMVASDYNGTAAFKAALVAASAGTFRDLLFSSTSNPNNFMFKSSTAQLLPWNDDTKSYLGNSVIVYRGNALLTGEDADLFVDPTSPAVLPGRPVARMCTISAAEQAFCEATVPAMDSDIMTYSCVQRTSDDECMAAIKAGIADWRTYAAAQIYTAGNEYDLKAVVAEDAGNRDAATTYFSVGVVAKEFCTAGVTLADLRGKKSCHTAYRRNAGWQIPIGFLAGSGVMPIVRGAGGIPDEAESVASFFSGSCASNFKDNRNQTFAPLCSACYTDADTPTPNCTTPAEPYSDYPGSFRGMLEGSCDVSFTQSRIPLEYCTDGTLNATARPTWSNKPKSDFRLLCPSGGCASVDDYTSCNLGRVPADAVMVSASWPYANVLKESLIAAAKNSTVKAAVFNATTNPSGYVFKSSTVRLLRIDDDTRTYLGNSFTVYKGNELLYSVGPNQFVDPTVPPSILTPTARMCTISDSEQAFCNRLLPLLNNGTITFSCIQRANDAACMAAIQSGAADARTFAAAEIYTANKDYDLKAVVAEDAGGVDQATTYFSVGVVPATFCTPTTTLADLRGVKSCHTAYRRNAGWQIPIGFLAGSGVMPIIRGSGGIADDAESVASFFNGSCASNFLDARNRTWAPMCSACYTDANTPVANCTTPAEPYSDYPGSFRGMLEGKCGVSFTQSRIPLEYSTDGSLNATARPAWANKPKSAFRLICPSGGCATVDNYTACNLGRVPADAVMVRSGYIYTNVLKTALLAASNDPAFRTLVFNRTTNTGDFVFKASVVNLLRIDDDTKTYLGNSAVVYKGNALLAGPEANTFYDPSAPISRTSVPRARYCSTTDAEDALCLQVSALLNSSTLTVSCHRHASEAECMTAIQQHQADWRTFGAADIFTAHRDYDLKVIVAEDAGNIDVSTTYFSVGVVNKDFCTASTNLSSLRGIKSCHTGYRRNAGWQVPVGFLAGSGVMPIVRGLGGVADDAESVAAFFGGSCAPNFQDSKGSKWAPMCSACKSTCVGPTEEYFDYPGTLRGLMEGACGVAFTQSRIPMEYSKDGSMPADWATKNMDDFRLICPGFGGCVPVTEYARCNMGRVPADAVMVRASWSTTEALKTALVAASSNATFRALVFGAANPTSAMFGSGSVRLLRVDDDTKAYLGNSDTVYKGNLMLAEVGPATYRDPSTSAVVGVPSTRMCTISDAEQAFCARMVPLMNSDAMTFNCVKRTSDAECMRAIQAGEADARTFASAEMYTANRDYDLKVVIAEDQNNTDLATTYYSVGVVNKDFCTATTTLADLKGKRSCHTGYRRNAGWQIPVGYLLGSGVMPLVRNSANHNDDAESVAAFFSGSCAANFKDAAGNKWDRLCSACKGDCAPNNVTEPFYDYPGAFRGVHDRGCDVGFTQSRYPIELSADGTAKAPWATRNKDDFRLICSSGGCAPLEDYYKCNLGRVPADAVMVRSDYPQAQVLKTALLAASVKPEFRALVFNATQNPGNSVFRANTVSLLRLDDDTKAYLGNSATVYKGLEASNNPNGTICPVAAPSDSGTKSGLSSGQIAGIVIGCSIGLALLAALITALVTQALMRRRLGGAGTDRAYSKDLNGEVKPGCAPGCFKSPDVV